MKLYIIDYIGSCDENGKPIGHSMKTINEFGECLMDSFDLELILSKYYVPYLKKHFMYHALDLHSRLNNNFFVRIINIFRKIVTIKNIIKNKNNNIWFINTDFWLFFTLFFTRTNDKKIYITNYLNYLSYPGIKGRIKRFFYERSVKKVRYVFTSDINCKIDNHVFIPDFFFDKSFYDTYISTKTDRVVCLGDMNPGKEIEKMVDVFNNNGLDLLIAGKFFSEELIEAVESKAESNIEIINTFLQEDEYYKIFGGAKYCILPYKVENYKNRSSGILLEAAFLGTLVIAPDFLLEYNGIEGLGYKNIIDLNSDFLNKPACYLEKILNNNFNKAINYDKYIIKEKLISIFNS